MSPTQAIKSAWDALRIFRAAQRDAERVQDATEARAKGIGRKDEELRAKLAEVDKRDQKLLEQESRLAERERNAEAGFLDERRRIVDEVNAQVTELRRQLAALAVDADKRQSEEEAAWRRRLDERAGMWRHEEDERAERWRREDGERAHAVEQERRRLADELTRERERAQLARAEEQVRYAARIEAEVEARRGGPGRPRRGTTGSAPRAHRDRRGARGARGRSASARRQGRAGRCGPRRRARTAARGLG